MRPRVEGFRVFGGKILITQKHQGLSHLGQGRLALGLGMIGLIATYTSAF